MTPKILRVLPFTIWIFPPPAVEDDYVVVLEAREIGAYTVTHHVLVLPHFEVKVVWTIAISLDVVLHWSISSESAAFFEIHESQ